MAVSGLEQRCAPLILRQPVWSPWGVGVLIPWSCDEEEAEHSLDASEKPKLQRRRSHSWAGHASLMQKALYAQLFQERLVTTAAVAVNRTDGQKHGGKSAGSSGTNDSKSPSISASTFISGSSSNDDGGSDLGNNTPTEVNYQYESNATIEELAVVEAEAELCSVATTLAIRNLPQNLTRAQLLQAVDESGFASRYDFVHMPHQFEMRKSLGFAFINFTHVDVAQEFQATWHKSRRFTGKCNSNRVKPLNVSVARVQGCPASALKAKSKKIRNDSYRPLLLAGSVDKDDCRSIA